MTSGPIRVLLVEDDASGAHLIRKVLSNITTTPFEVTRVKRLDEASTQLDRQNIDVVLLDLSLPDSGGLETLLRLHHHVPGVPVVVLTGTDDDALAIKAIQAGAQDYLVKGQIDSNLVGRTLRYAIERQRTAEALHKSHTIIENNADGIVILDGDGSIRFINSAAEELFGLKAQELTGELLGFPLTSDNPAEMNLVSRQGQKIIAEMRVTEIEWEGQTSYLISLRDITERRQVEESEREQRELAEALREVGVALSSALDFEAVLDRMLDQIARVVAYDAANIMLVKDGRVSTARMRGYEQFGEQVAQDIAGLSFEVANTANLRWMAETGQPLVIPDTADYPDWEQVRAWAHVRSWAGAPIMVQGQIVAFFSLDKVEPDFYQPKHADRLAAFAGQAAIAIENARLYDQIRQRVDELTTLNMISQVITSTLDWKKALTIITEHTTRLLDVEATSLVLHDETTDDLQFAVTAGKGADIVREMRLAIGQGIAGWVVKHGKPLLVRDVQEDPHFCRDFDRRSGFTTKSVLCVPLQTKHQTIGAIEAINKQNGNFDQADLRLLGLLAAPAATALENARLYEQAQQEIAERKRAEAALEEERATLARRVQERTADLSAANAKLAEAARLKDEFLASMSHELRTPLNAVLGLSEALQEQVYGPLNEDQESILRSIEESGRHLLSLINDILDLSKIGAGKLELELGPVSVKSVCQASLRLIKQLAHKKRLKVSSSFDSQVTTIQADGRRLKQILVNLMSNAVKFTPEGGKIGLEVVGNVEQQLVNFTVWDTGIGVAQDQVATLFQPFVQVDSSLSRSYEGSGLGLSLVYGMVELHGGSLSVESEPGRGSRFIVSLPWEGPGRANGAIYEPASALTGLVPPEMPAIRQALIIEDSPTTASQFNRYLNRLGADTIIHRRGDGAVKKALETKPNVIILDIRLPDLSGWNVLARLKANPLTKDIPVLIVSVVDDRPHGLAMGAAEYLVKPISHHDLQQALHKILPRNGTSAGQKALVVVPDRSPKSDRPLILLAEDNESNISTVSDYLLVNGYQVVVARNGEEVIERAREENPELILMDIQMPGMDGLEATRLIRADSSPRVAGTPIIALTALAMPGDRERCLTAGANEYLSKPVSLKGLLRTIETQL
ncbi:MAG: response regulator [Anaerolineae bacterium]